MSAASEPSPAPLTNLEQAILAFETRIWSSTGAKEHAVIHEFAMPIISYRRILNELIERPDVYATDPATINRLRQLRYQRRPVTDLPPL